MNDKQICQWVVDQRVILKKFTDEAAAVAAEKRELVFKKLLVVNNAMVELFWEINIARDKEHKDKIALPNS